MRALHERVRFLQSTFFFHLKITFFFILQTVLTLVLYYCLNKINFSFLFSGFPLFFYWLISIILFFEIYFIINYIHFKENDVKLSFFIQVIVFKTLELFFLFFISQYINSKYIYYIYISIAISLIIHSITLNFNKDDFKKYLIITVCIVILNNLVLLLFYLFNYFEIKFLNFVFFSVFYSIFLFLFCLINYKLIIGHGSEKVGLYSLFSSILIYFGIFIIFFEKLGAHKINT
jgi:hypothetical protein